MPRRHFITRWLSAGNHRPPSGPFSRAAAFTLVELLVVVAVIAVLAALLLPSLVAAKMQAARIQCVSNERQMLVAWTLYSGDNDDRLVVNGGDMNTISVQPHLWVYGGAHGSSDSLTNDLYLTGADYALFAYTKVQPSGRLYKCPGDNSTWPLWGLPGAAPSEYVAESRSYALNSYMGTISPYNIGPLLFNAPYRIFLKSSQIAADSPVNRFVFADVNPASICTPGFGVDMTQSVWIHYPSDQHRLRGVLVFADSHVEVHRWQDARTMVHLGSGTYIPHDTPAYNNPDLAWLCAKTTSLR